MSGGSIQKIDEECVKSKESLQSPQNAWMSRWMRGSHSEAAQPHRSYRADEDFEDVSNQSVGPKPIRSFTIGESKSCEVRNAKPVRSFNTGESKSCEVGKQNIGKNPGSSENEGMSISLFKNDHEIGVMQALKASVCDQNLADCGKAVDVRMFTTSKSLQEVRKKSPSHLVPFNFDLEKHNKGKAVMSPIDPQASFFSKQDMTLLKHDHRHVQARNINFPEFPVLENAPYAGARARSLSVLGPNSLSNTRGSVASKEIERKMSHNRSSHPQQKLQHCVGGDVEAIRFRTTLEGIQGANGPMFSETTHGLLITEKADANVSNKEEVFGSTRVITRFDGSHSSNFISLSAFFGRNVVGVKVLPVNSCLERKFGEVKSSKLTIRNESSAETDTMDLDSLKEMNSHSGELSIKSTKMKDINKTTLPPMRAFTCSTEAKSQHPKRQIPDINAKLPFLHAASADPRDATMCASSSRTKSLVVNRPDRPGPVPIFGPIYSDDVDPGNRWVKRLKVSHGNNSGLSEDVSHGKLLLAKILNTGMPSAAAITPTEEHRGDESPKKDEELVARVDDDKGKEVLLSHPWIKRWLHSNEPEKKPVAATVLCEPQTLKLVMDEDVGKEQFPSIGAMALMGRAMNGFELCEVKKRGSFTIWNTKTF